MTTRTAYPPVTVIRTMIVATLSLAAMIGCSITAVPRAATQTDPAAATVAASAEAVRATAAPAKNRWVMGYYVVYQRGLMPVSEIDWGAMSHLVVGRVIARANGSIDQSFDWDPTAGPRFARSLSAAAKRHGVVPVLMVGGAGEHDAFVSAARNHRAALVRNLVAVMRNNGFSGLDIDWEPVLAADRTPLLALVSDLRKALPTAVLTMPVGWVTQAFPVEFPTFYRNLSTKLDRLNVMSYGMAGAWDGWRTWHSSALKGASSSTPSSIAVNVNGYLAAGVPARKLGIGIGFYGSCWAGGVTEPRQQIGGSSIVADDNTMSWTAIMRSFYTAGAYRYDTAAEAPYLTYPSGRGPQRCTFVSYENGRSVQAKGAYAVARGLGAEIVWTINQGHVRGAGAGKTDPMLRAVRNSFR